MRTIWMIKGISSSGKSTWALEQMRKYPGRYKRVNRDLLREMIDGNALSTENEAFLKRIRDLFIEKTLLQEHDIIIDDMNLNNDNWKTVCDIASLIGDVRVVEKYFEVSLKDALTRNASRSKPVPEHILENQYKRYVRNKHIQVRDEYFPPVIVDFTIDPKKKMAAIVDIDGTIAMKYSDRSYFDLERVEEDTLNEHISTLIDLLVLNGNMDILLVSGRADFNKDKTEAWLQQTKPHYDKLFMRRTGDRRPDWIVKKEIYEDQIKPHYNVLYVIDDRPIVCRMWRNMGLTVLQINDKEV